MKKKKKPGEFEMTELEIARSNCSSKQLEFTMTEGQIQGK